MNTIVMLKSRSRLHSGIVEGPGQLLHSIKDVNMNYGTENMMFCLT